MTHIYANHSKVCTSNEFVDPRARAWMALDDAGGVCPECLISADVRLRHAARCQFQWKHSLSATKDALLPKANPRYDS